MIYQIIGILGTCCVIFGYWKVATLRWAGNDNKTLYLNLIGALLLSVSLTANPNIGSILIEVFYSGITIYVYIKKHLNRYR